MKVIGIVGWKNSGKTTLVEKLIRFFLKKRIFVSTIKHSHHNFQIDKKGKDSFRHKEAGARETILASELEWVKFSKEIPKEDDHLNFYLRQLSSVDIVLVEGYKKNNQKKIEIFDSNSGKQPIFLRDKTILAVASADTNLKADIPVFDRNEVEKIGDFILNLIDIKN